MDGVIGTWDFLPPDGEYCLKVTAVDSAGNTSEATVTVHVDTAPPAATVLSGEVRNVKDVYLSWNEVVDNGLSGYNVYRDGARLNSAPLSVTEYLDAGLSDGDYTYMVRALDSSGLESEDSNQVSLRVNAVGPTVNIYSPNDGRYVSGYVEIKGTAYDPDDFTEYRVYIGAGISPATWQLIRKSPVPVRSDTLTWWDTTGLAEGAWSIRLEAVDSVGNLSDDVVSVTVDNTPPSAPVLLSAIPSGQNIELTWQENPETDIAGYLVLRNGKIVNASSSVLSSLLRYAIEGTSYNDTDLPDDDYAYYLMAIDRAGNISPASNILTVLLDTRAPTAEIIQPEDGLVFDTPETVVAVTQDNDVAQVQFQYQAGSGTTQWTDLGSAKTFAPYETVFDPASFGLQYDQYSLRAVATDKGGKTDSVPPTITVSYADITSPAAPTGLVESLEGDTVTLTWNENGEADLAGYNVYRDGVLLNTSLVNSTSYI